MITLKELKQNIASHPFFSSPFYLRHKHLVISGMVLVFALLIAGLVTIPQFLRLFETFRSIDDLSAKKTFFENKNATLESIDLELYRANLDTALKALPVDKNVPGVTGELLVALSGSGMKLEGISFAAGQEETTQVQEYTLKFDVSGDEDGLKSFLERIKVLPRIIKMTALDVARARQQTLNASITLVTLHQSLPTNIGDAESPVPEISDSDRNVLAKIEERADALPQQQESTGAQPVSGKLNPFAQ